MTEEEKWLMIFTVSLVGAINPLAGFVLLVIGFMSRPY